VIGLLLAAAIFATIPISPQITPRGLELSVDQAQAITYGRYRRVHRRVYRRAYRRAYYWVLPYYYGARSYYYGASYYYGIPTMLSELLWAVVLMVRWRLSIDRHEGGLCASQNGRTEVTRCCGMTANAG
jgi:hypothetical protein